ncbi:MAG: hypothetical protein SWJ54_03895 [Cyanobacteriota bacterium]|nr:hypothetical protein [Cyanobacteriota bacterium]
MLLSRLLSDGSPHLLLPESFRTHPALLAIPKFPNSDKSRTRFSALATLYHLPSDALARGHPVQVYWIS